MRLLALPSLVEKRILGHDCKGGDDIMSAEIQTYRFETPDDRLDMKDAGGISIIQTNTGTTGMHAIFEPGWT